MCLAALDALVHAPAAVPEAVADELFDIAWGYTDQ